MENQEIKEDKCVKCLEKGMEAGSCIRLCADCKFEELEELKPVRITYKCPKCNKGHLEFSGTARLTSPLQNEHRCTNKECDLKKVYISDKKYPTIEYR